jgi:hypothetical protein
MINQSEEELEVFCRQCGGDRYHTVKSDFKRTWDEGETPIFGGINGELLNAEAAVPLRFSMSIGSPKMK